jgi:hypothetical protein
LVHLSKGEKVTRPHKLFEEIWKDLLVYNPDSDETRRGTNEKKKKI